ncbi:alpha/beta fold hydrolase [Gracilimonas sp. BCB1]|uniref:alpha/beta fold hydrolase n=1 Tax=Gracilimonas sp. BCB1 TaxID=3152362 RepID=UPI0032D8DADD
MEIRGFVLLWSLVAGLHERARASIINPNGAIELGKDIFKSQEARSRQEEWYQLFLAKVELNVEFKMVTTSFGESHVLVAGNPDKPPLICLHAMLTSSAHLLSEIRYLAGHYQLILPDIPGFSVKGIPERLSFKDNSHSQWLAEVIDSFELETVHLFGISIGGYIVREFSTAFPERVEKLVLLVPAGIFQAPVIKGLMSLTIPMIKYKFNPSEENLKNLADYFLTTRDDDWAHFLGDSINDFITPKKIPSVASDEELQNLKMPVLTIAADKDMSFPGEPLIERAKDHILNVETELLRDTRHSPPTTEEFRRWLADRITFFLKE